MKCLRMSLNYYCLSDFSDICPVSSATCFHSELWIILNNVTLMLLDWPFVTIELFVANFHKPNTFWTLISKALPLFSGTLFTGAHDCVSLETSLTSKVHREVEKLQTSRDGPKSAPYPRLKNSKKTSKCQVFFYSSRKSKIFRNFFWKNYILKKWTEWRAVSQCRKTERGTLWGFSTSILSQNMKKLKKKKFFYFREKISQCQKNWKEEPFVIFQHPFCRKTSKKCRGDPLREKNSKKKSEKKYLAVPKNLKGGTLWSRPVWYVTRKNR